MSPHLQAWVHQFVARVTQDDVVDDFVRRVDDGIMRLIPDLAADPILTQDLHASTRGQWVSFAAHLGREHEFEMPPTAADLARTLARRGFDLAVLLKIYRSAHQFVFQFFTDVTDSLSEDEPPRDEVLKFMWTRAERWMDDSVEHLIETFYSERQQLVEGALIRRTQRIEEILRGGSVGVDEASRELTHALAQWQTGLTVWATGTTTMESLADLAHEAARLLQAPRPLTLPAASRDLWFWTATPQEPDLAALAALVPALEAAQAQLSVGVPRPGIAGFRSSHAEARAAQRVALTAARPRALVHYRDVELVCLVENNDDLVRRMVTREIGELLGADKNLGLVRETALVYLTQRQNVEATADRLFVHKNTVRYRLGRAEELLGHPLTERAANVELALRYVALFGPPVDVG